MGWWLENIIFMLLIIGVTLVVMLLFGYYYPSQDDILIEVPGLVKIARTQIDGWHNYIWLNVLCAIGMICGIVVTMLFSELCYWLSRIKK